MTIPAICARIDSDNNKTSKVKYIDWFNTYLAETYKHRIDSEQKYVFLTGDDLHALRCSVLHEGILNISTQKTQKVYEKFFFTVGPPHLRQINSIFQLDLPTFCHEICDGVLNWLELNSKNPKIKEKLNELLLIFDKNTFSTNDIQK